MTIKAWVDSGANIHSKNTIDVKVDEEEWNEMTDDQKSDLVYEQISQYFDWGWEE